MFLLLAAEEEKAMAKKKLQSATAAAAAAAIAGFDQPQEWKQEVEEWEAWQLERSPSGHWAIDRLDGTQLDSNAVLCSALFFWPISFADMKITYDRTKSVAVTPAFHFLLPLQLLPLTPIIVLQAHCLVVPELSTPPTVDRGGRFCML